MPKSIESLPEAEDDTHPDQSATPEPSNPTPPLTPPLATTDLASKAAPSLTLSFLEDCTAHLSPEEKEPFYQSTGKFIEEKLSQVDPSLQQTIIDYATYEGLLYPYVMQHYQPSEWIQQSLLKEIATYPHEDTITLNQFRANWLKITQQYSDPIPLLKSLRIQKILYNLPLLEISNLLDWVLHTDRAGYDTICSQEGKCSINCVKPTSKNSF